jgi:hypothetical protein
MKISEGNADKDPITSAKRGHIKSLEQTMGHGDKQLSQIVEKSRRSTRYSAHFSGNG